MSRLVDVVVAALLADLRSGSIASGMSSDAADASSTFLAFFSVGALGVALVDFGCSDLSTTCFAAARARVTRLGGDNGGAGAMILGVLAAARVDRDLDKIILADGMETISAA